MSPHKICFYREIRKISIPFGYKKKTKKNLFGALKCYVSLPQIYLLQPLLLSFFQSKMDRMTENLDKARSLQTVLKMFEARDRNIVESNFDRVNFLSCVQLVIMIGVGLTQVIMIRQLFNDSSRVSGKLKTRT